VRIVLLGPPGAGKGSLALLCHNRCGIAHVSTGEIFRREIARASPLGGRVGRYVTNGRLVPDALVVQVMANVLKRKRFARGFVLDGFPRTKAQADRLERVLKSQRQPLDGAVYVSSSEDVLIKRLSGRRVCKRCGANYHLRTMRPKLPGKCDRCRGALMTRPDDRPSTIRKRLCIARRTEKPLLSYYQRHGLLFRVDGRGHIETVFQRALGLFHRQGWL
jgi:adenylate kinase